jgi:drug/metabolite transporter (DMT)-like permease
MNKLFFAVPLLILCVTAFASGATAFIAMGDVSPGLFTVWRMQLTTITTLLISLWDWRTQPHKCIAMFGQSWHLIALGGLFFSLFFNLYSLSLTLTSITHAILAYSACPAFIFLIDFLLGKPVYKWEVFGASISIGGIALIVISSHTEVGSYWVGDLVAITGALFLALFTIVTATALKDYDCPALTYLSASNLFSALVSLVLISIVDPSDLALAFDWVSTQHIWVLLYAAIVVGSIVQLVFNSQLKYLSPVLVTVFANLEPAIGSLIGWFFGYQGIPSILTWLGGLICISGSIIVTLCGNDANSVEPESMESEIGLVKHYI